LGDGVEEPVHYVGKVFVAWDAFAFVFEDYVEGFAFAGVCDYGSESEKLVRGTFELVKICGKREEGEVNSGVRSVLRPP
jgi:hypothetical protein